MIEKEIEVYEDITQFYGAFSFVAPVVIDDLALKYKELLNFQTEQKEEVIIEIYCNLIPYMKKELLRMGVSHSELDDGISISWEVLTYLLDTWEIKYYQNRNLTKNNLKGAKKNSFFGYYFTYYKSIYFQKVNYSKDYNGNLIKKSKHEDIKVKQECAKIDRKVTISRKNKKIMKDKLIARNTIDICDDGNVIIENECLGKKDNYLELRDYMSRNYTKSEIECIMYVAKLGEKNLDDLGRKIGMKLDSTRKYIKDTLYKAERDKELYNMLLESLQ